MPMNTNSGIASSVEFVTTPNRRCGRRLNSSVPKPRKPNTKPEIAKRQRNRNSSQQQGEKRRQHQDGEHFHRKHHALRSAIELLIASDSDCMKNNAKPIGISDLTT